LTQSFLPDGNLYVTSANDVKRFDGITGAFIDDFVTGVFFPHTLTFGPDGNLYAGSESMGGVDRFDGVTGAFIDTFVALGSGGLLNVNGSPFGPDGNLYLVDGDRVKRYNGMTGAFIDNFVTGGGVLNFGQDLEFRVTNVVPEPGTFALFASALLPLFFVVRRTSVGTK
jgi:outer membrane protein assembly factor BamB